MAVCGNYYFCGVNALRPRCIFYRTLIRSISFVRIKTLRYAKLRQTLSNDCLQEICLVYILSGSLTLVQQGSSIPGSKNKTDSEVHSHNAYPGEMIGGLAVLTGESSLYTVRAKHYSRIALLKRNTVYR